ncbi:MAG: hypothetical protein FWE27_07510 [Defluviitaleaceae bacterium]|nr:hypothetical protein [Defluviitaleaceae bacterium]
MPDQIKKYVDPLKARWDILTPPQRNKLLGVIAVVLIAIVLTALIAFRTPWETIVSGESRQVIEPMRIALTNAGIKHRTRVHGSALQVDGRRVDDAIGIINIEGIAPNNEHITWAIALDTGLGTTDDERRRREIMGMEGQIERQLIMVQGINSAIVNLSVPTYRPFERDATQPSASVTLSVSQDFSNTQGRNIALLVARNVARLEPERIIIVNQFARTIWNGEDSGEDNPVNTAHQMREQFRNQGVINLRQNLSLVFDEVDVVFNPWFDDTLLTNQVIETFTPSEGMDGGGIIRAEREQRASVTGGTGGIEPGLAPNSAVIPGYVLPGGGVMEASNREFEREYEVDRRIVEIQNGPGWVVPDRSTASVMAVVERHVPQKLWMSSVPDGAAPLTQEDWDRYKMENRMPSAFTDFPDFNTFREIAASALGIPVDNVQLMIMQRIIPQDIVVRVWPIETILMLAVLFLLLTMLFIGLLRKQRAAGEDEESLEPQLAVEDLLVSTQLEEAREEEAAQLEEIDYHKENEVKRHIERFVNEKPESVAALLRNWINVEEW